MEQGPVLILTFQAQQTMVVTDSRGKIVEGGIVSIFQKGVAIMNLMLKDIHGNFHLYTVASL